KYVKAHLETGCHFFAYSWASGNRTMTDHGSIVEVSFPKGVMLFMTRECLLTICGMDTKFGRYSHEHVGMQRRAFNAGLAPYPYCDIPNSSDLFYSLDKEGRIKGTVKNKQEYFDKNRPYFRSRKNSSQFVDYK